MPLVRAWVVLNGRNGDERKVGNSGPFACLLR